MMKKRFQQPGHPEIRYSFVLRHSAFVIFRRETELQRAAVSRSYHPAAALRISIVCAQCLLDRAVSPVSHAEFRRAAVPVVGPGSLFESFRLEPPSECPERIVSFGK